MKSRMGLIVRSVLVTILLLIVLVVAKGIWLAKVNHHYDVIISDYIKLTQEHNDDDHDELRARLVQEGILMKMGSWDDESFIKDKQLYEEMLRKHKEAKAGRDHIEGAVESVFNL